MTQNGVNGPVSFTMTFASPLTSLSFTRPKLLTGPSGITHPSWSAHAFDVKGLKVSTAGEAMISSFMDVPAATFVLQGNGIKSVQFDSDGYNFTAFSAVLLDDFIPVFSPYTPHTLADAIKALQIMSGSAPAGVSISLDVDGNRKIGMPEAIYILQEVSGMRP
jgi:hypothetical protein